MNITITPALLRGSIVPPPSKSQAHRLILAAALAQGESSITHAAHSQDIDVTVACMEALGAKIRWTAPDTLSVTGLGSRRGSCSACMADAVHLDCGESGSTLRFLIPVALAVAGGAFFTGRGRLLSRPQGPYADLFQEKGIFFHQSPNAISVRGTLTPGEYALPGNVSSQFVTGLLYALPLLEGDSEIVLTSPLESKGYVDMTLETLARFGVAAHETARGYRVRGGQHYQCAQAAVEGDFSQAGFYYAANALGSQVEIRGMNAASAQGDRVIADLSERLRLSGALDIDVSQCPDLVPPLAVQAALRTGETTRLVHAARLRMKESDRLSTVAATLNALGAQVAEGADYLDIRGVEALRGGTAVDCCNDHRIAMMAAVAASRCREAVTLLGAECVAKSYPGFWADYERLGGRITREEA